MKGLLSSGTRRSFLRGLLTGAAAVAAAATLPPGVLVEDLSDEDLEALRLRVDWSQLDIGGNTITIHNPTSSPVDVRGVSYGSERNGALWVARVELQANEDRFVWGAR